jgi:acetyl esterase/lipase
MASLRSRLVRAVTGRYFRAIDANRTDVPALRRRWRHFARYLPVAPRTAVLRVSVAGVEAEWLAPPASAADKLILYLHGGAYVAGNCDTHRSLASHIATAAGVRVLLPEYRLAPEHPFPAALDDALGIYRELLASGVATDDIVIAGDSAGGGLTMATLLALRDAGDPLPAAACLLSPWLDLAGTGESMRTRAAYDPWFRPEFLPPVRRYYCDESRVLDPLVSPVYARLDQLPPLYIQVGEDEILLSDSTRVAAAVAEAGGVAELEVWPDMWHVFQMFVREMPEARRAVAALGLRVRSAVGLPTGSEA